MKRPSNLLLWFVICIALILAIFVAGRMIVYVGNQIEPGSQIDPD